MTVRWIGQIIGLMLFGGPIVMIGCAGHGTRETGFRAGSDEPCLLLAGEPAGGVRPVRIAMTDRVWAMDAPSPLNDSERLLFGTLYETLVTVDCLGRIEPGLAESWTVSDDWKTWTFKLREGAVFWDGEPVEPRLINAYWHASENPWSMKPRHWLGRDQIRGISDRTVEIRLEVGDPELLYLLSHPSFGIAGNDMKPSATPKSEYPIGTGAWMIEPGSHVRHGKLVCIPNRKHPLGKDLAGSLVFDFRSIQDEAEPALLPPDIDLLITRERDVFQYAERSSDFTDQPLPFDLDYYLVAVDRTKSVAALSADPELQCGLVRDVANTDAEELTSLYPPGTGDPIQTRLDLPGQHPYPPPMETLGKIAYPLFDDEARRIAERLSWKISALDSIGPVDSIATSRGGPLAHVVPVRREKIGESRRLNALLRQSPWLVRDREPPSSKMPQATPSQQIAIELITPLYTTRPHMVSRRGLTGITIDYHGVIRLVHSGWRKDAPSP